MPALPSTAKQAGKSDPQGAAHARPRRAHLAPTYLPRMHGLPPTRHLHMHAARAVSTRACPAPVRAAGPRVAGARAPPQISARLAQRHAASAHLLAALHPAAGSRHVHACLCAPGAHCFTHMTARMSEKAPWSACRAARSGGARTAFPGQMAHRGPAHAALISGDSSPSLSPGRSPGPPPISPALRLRGGGEGTGSLYTHIYGMIKNLPSQ